MQYTNNRCFHAFIIFINLQKKTWLTGLLGQVKKSVFGNTVRVNSVKTIKQILFTIFLKNTFSIYL